jgi:hypothetical protein
MTLNIHKAYGYEKKVVIANGENMAMKSANNFTRVFKIWNHTVFNPL